MKDGYKLLCLFDPHIETLPDGKGGWKPATAKALDTALEFGAWWKPDETLTGHDFMEFAPISYWNRRKKLDMEGRRLSYDFAYANQVLDKICAFTKQKITFQPGNHDIWLNSYVQMHPYLDTILTQKELLDFKGREIDYIKGQTFESMKMYRVGKASFIHAFLKPRTNTTKYHSARMSEDYGKSIFYGHWHTFQVFTRISWDSKPNTAVAIGSLSNLNPGWMRNMPNNFVNQFLFMEFDSKGHFSYYCPIMINGKFRFQGKLFGGK